MLAEIWNSNKTSSFSWKASGYKNTKTQELMQEYKKEKGPTSFFIEWRPERSINEMESDNANNEAMPKTK